MMRRLTIGTATIAALMIWLSFASLPREWTDLFWLLRTRVTRRMTGGPAPYDDCSFSDDPDTHTVNLANGHSLDQHKQVIGRAAD